MLRNYLTIAFRNLLKNKVYSSINIVGLSIGMAVAMLIGLWIWDELSFNKYHQHYNRLTQVWMTQTWNGEVNPQKAMPFPLANELRTKFKDDFPYVAMSSWWGDYILAYGDKKITRTGTAAEPDLPVMLSLKMLQGTRNGLTDPSSILISQSLATTLFGDEDAMNKVIKVDNKLNVKVTGVYEDLPHNSDFHELLFMIPWQLHVSTHEWIKNSQDAWDSNSYQIFAQLSPQADATQLSAKIRNVIKDHLKEDKFATQQVFLHPMNLWHLHSEFKNGVVSGGRIEFVWLFGIIGVFVLLLACINFMNLSTARSEKRAKEVGIRKTLGSIRQQLIYQFLSESILMTLLAFALALAWVILALPAFNEVADKAIVLPWSNSVFWVLCLSFTVLTGLIAGSYPAFYLSSFNPVKVLKGTFRAGRYAAIPRKALVVLQFTVSISLIIGTMVVFRQVQHAKNRPVGYSREGLLYVNMNTKEIYDNYEALKNDLLASGAVESVCVSSSPVTNVFSTNGGFEWPGKDPNQSVMLGTIAGDYGYGKTVGFQLISGRDFSKDFSTDSSAIILNEKAAKFMGLENPVGQTIKWHKDAYHVIGVVKDMVMDSPYSPVLPTVFLLKPDWAGLVNVRITPALSTREALSRITPIFQQHDPGSPFDYKFADQEYDLKFKSEERIGQLASFFAALAIFISCLGLFGLASFTAEQRVKEIGVRKVLGASILDLWMLLSKDFVSLVLVSLLIAVPVAWYLMYIWLQRYEYRSGISWWIMVSSAAGALLITLLTVSYQSIKAALANPVKSLRNE
ncbi:ABC transporter permease [Rhodocytophaga aerolata]|uniref:ABC transporter permease n=1 Tax=Rhodocytophaga aerolata TaxID=455078 RepID=A0ABT8R5J2_9BACT|nr:ABC transporter permease [Rhodocytophaga aerolata]MDO1447360.1 ABC transporter permease [Rhodocytophaga aerolata]